MEYMQQFSDQPVPPTYLHSFLKEMLDEDINIRYSLRIGDSTIIKESEPSPKELMNYLKKMKDKSDDEIIKGLKKKFKLGKDDAERALELIKIN